MLLVPTPLSPQLLLLLVVVAGAAAVAVEGLLSVDYVAVVAVGIAVLGDAGAALA